MNPLKRMRRIEMICPACGWDLTRKCFSTSSAAQALGSIGGRTTGKTKARAVDYRELARLSHQARRENKAKKHQ